MPLRPFCRNRQDGEDPATFSVLLNIRGWAGRSWRYVASSPERAPVPAGESAMFARSLVAGALLAALAPVAFGQAVRAVPYNAQLHTDPDVGNVQGIQRYGRPLCTDPDQGEGYSYHV